MKGKIEIEIVNVFGRRVIEGQMCGQGWRKKWVARRFSGARDAIR